MITQQTILARAFATKHHGDQMYGDLPYVAHLDAVAESIEQYGEQAVILAYLHDIVEDTQVTLDDVSSEFGTFIAQCVFILTDEPGFNRKIKKRATYKKMSQVTEEHNIALIVKAADRLVNMKASLSNKNIRLIQIYIQEYPAFKKSVYRNNLCEDLWGELNEHYQKLLNFASSI